MTGKIIHKGKTSTDSSFVIKYPSIKDTGALCKYINILSREKTFIRYQGEHISLKEEREFLNKIHQKIKKQEAIMLILISNNKVVGISSIEMRNRIENHVGDFGISLLKEFRSLGLGKLFLEKVLDEAQKHLPNLKIVVLGVFENNHIAINMYKKFGFVEFGRLPRGVCYKGNMIDHIYMYKNIDQG